MHHRLNRPSLLWLLAALSLACSSDQTGSAPVPGWVQDAVFYQIFPERFRNGDPANDPVRSSLDYLEYVPESWAVSEWTKDWYAQDPWEREKSDNVYAAMFDRRFGGDLQGVIDKLDYLQELGINAIWFNPVFQARSLHKYDGSSFHHIDPHFGPDPEGDKAIIVQESHDPATWSWTSADKLFLQLVNEAHRRDIRIILDGVFNHTGRGFFAFEDLATNQAESPYRDWYHVEAFDDASTPENEFKYAGWWGYEALPEFADNEAGDDLQADVKAYIMASTVRWMDPDQDSDPSDGIDGWRLDVAQDVPTGFWRQWNHAVRSINAEAYTVAEIWTPAATYVQDAAFSAAMNYHAFAMPVKGFLIDGAIPAQQFADIMAERYQQWPVGMGSEQLNLIDSHDTPRLASMVRNRTTTYQGGGNEYDYDSGAKGPESLTIYDVGQPDMDDQAIMRLVAFFQFTYAGAPIIYYGTESGMWGADDPDNRKPMIWDDLAYDDQAQGPFGPDTVSIPVGFNAEMRAFYTELVSMRSRHPALRSGDVHMESIGESDDVLIMHRSTSNQSLVVLINRGNEPVNTTWIQEEGATMLFSTDSNVSRTAAGEVLLPRLAGAVFLLAGKNVQEKEKNEIM